MRVPALAAVVVLAAGLAACSPRAVVVHAGRPAPAAAKPGAAPADGLDPDLTLADLATLGEGDWQRYRIPALTVAPNGDLLAFYDGRPTMQDLPSNIALLMRRSTDGGKRWHEPRVIRAAPAPAGFGDPSVLVDRVTGDVFVFHAASMDAGFASSTTGRDPADPKVLHADYSVSSDNGVTWTHRRITAELKAGHADWAGMFAASGEGIQLRRGKYAGRLIQQYTVRRNGGNYAVSAWSDDHGVTWRTSEPVGPGADENKTVELSDGRIMLNARATPHRLVAFSSDGGATYTPLAADAALLDPGNNGSIIRAFPDAALGDPRARMLLFSNTANRHVRRRLTVRLSCDDGATWPVSRVVQAGASAYSTLTPLRGADGRLGGRYGLLYERDGYRYISYASFGLDWLGGGCDPAAARPGEAAGVAGDRAAHSATPLVLRPVLDAMYPDGPAGFLGDRIQPWVEVTNTGTVPLTDIAITATSGRGTCSLPSLAPGATAVCRNNTPNRIVTEADLAAGSWAPVFRATARAGAAIVEASAPLFPVDLVERRRGEIGAATIWVPTGVFESSSFARVPRVGAQGASLAQGSVARPAGAAQLEGVGAARRRGAGRTGRSARRRRNAHLAGRGEAAGSDGPGPLPGIRPGPGGRRRSRGSAPRGGVGGHRARTQPADLDHRSDSGGCTPSGLSSRRHREQRGRRDRTLPTAAHGAGRDAAQRRRPAVLAGSLGAPGRGRGLPGSGAMERRALRGSRALLVRPRRDRPARHQPRDRRGPLARRSPGHDPRADPQSVPLDRRLEMGRRSLLLRLRGVRPDRPRRADGRDRPGHPRVRASPVPGTGPHRLHGHAHWGEDVGDRGAGIAAVS